MNVLGKFWGTRKYRNIIADNNISLSEEYIDMERGGLSGQYCNINKVFVAIFSHKHKNYLLIDDKLVELNSDISITYYCEQNREEQSWLKIYDKEHLILDVIYKNNQKPFLDYIGGGSGEDWDIVNFAWHLAGYINKVKANPSVILFEDRSEKP